MAIHIIDKIKWFFLILCKATLDSLDRHSIANVISPYTSCRVSNIKFPLAIIHTERGDVSFSLWINNILNNLLKLSILSIIYSNVMRSNYGKVEVVIVKFGHDWIYLVIRLA